MSKSKDAKSKFAEAFASNKVVSTIKSNPVATTVTTGYIVGGTVAYAAAGVPIATAALYMAGKALLIGSVIYGINHAINKQESWKSL